MDVRLANADDRGAWDAFVASRPEADPLQSWAWGEANATAGERPLRLLATGDDGSVRGVAQLLVRSAGFGRSVVYIPHGPVWDRDIPDANDLLGRLVTGIRDQAKAERAIVVKVDPRAAAPPGPGDIADQLRPLGFRDARHDLQAPTTRIVDLLDGGDELMATWDKDARNLVRRSAKEGVTTTTDREGDPVAIATFHALLEATSSRAGFRIRSSTFLVTLARELASSGSWFLTLASLKGRPIAGAVALRTGDRAIYAYGASLREPELKHANGAYAALAATMRALAEDGVRTLDLWGVVEPGDPEADAAWAGFSAFKRQFGGEPLRHPGTFDLVIDPLFYRLRDLRERLRG
jgi:lipid II:glycine glycyltransferase (peptidoglycan interpeptide bridge formation enzyme)